MANEGDNLIYLQAVEMARLATSFTDPERAALDFLNRKVAGQPSLDAVMDLVYQTTRELGPCDRMGLAFLDDGGDRLVERWVRAEYQPVYLGPGYAEGLEGSSLKEVIHSGRPRLINDLVQYLDQHPASASSRLIAREGVRSSLTCPLSVDGRNVGVLFQSLRRPQAYGPREMALHLAMAERISQAVEKAWRIDQLEAANRAYFEMLGFVTHELKSPVAVMMTEAKMMLQGYYGPVEARQEQALQRVWDRGDLLTSLVGEYLDLARIEGGDLRPRFEELDAGAFANKVVNPAIENIRPLAEKKNMRIRHESEAASFRIRGDPGLLRIAVSNYLTNAVKYGRESGEIRLTLRTESPGLILCVRNEGPGFPATERSRLFKKFSRLDSPALSGQKGTGVGLYTVWKLVHLHGGKVSATSEEGQWAEFVFTVPLQTAGGAG